MAALTTYTSKPILVNLPISTVYDVSTFRVEDDESKFIVETLSATENILKWDRFNTNERVIIQKSEFELGGWFDIAELPSSTAPRFIDINANNTFHRHTAEWYRLVFPDIKLVTKGRSNYGLHDPVGAEIARRNRIILKNTRNGLPFILFTRMRAGERCPICWDKFLGKRTKSDCSTCNGTGYIQGYFDPVRIYVNVGAESVSMGVDEDGPGNKEGRVQAWTGNVPLLDTGDVLIEAGSHLIWEVSQVNITTHRRIITKQELVLTRVTGDDPVWKLVNRLKSGEYGWKEVPDAWQSITNPFQ